MLLNRKKSNYFLNLCFRKTFLRKQCNKVDTIHNEQCKNFFQTTHMQQVYQYYLSQKTCWLNLPGEDLSYLVTLQGKFPFTSAQGNGQIHKEKIFKFLDQLSIVLKMTMLGIKEIKFQNLSKRIFTSTIFIKSIPWATFINEIDKNDEDMLKTFKPEVRTKINKCIKENVFFEVCSSFEVFKNSFIPVWNQYKYDTPRTEEQILAMWEIGLKNGYNFFMAKLNSQVLAVGGGIKFKDMVTGIGSTTTKYAHDFKLGAMEYLNFNMFRYYRDQGYKFFDLAGFNPSNKSSVKEKGIENFKMKFGGKRTELVHQTIYSPLYVVYLMVLSCYLLLKKLFIKK